MIRLFLFLLLVLISTPTMAQEDIKLNQWSQLPVLHEGRLKPIDSVARIHLKKISNKSKINGMNASQWLAKIIFTPESATHIPVFLVRQQEALPLEARKNNLYSYIEITTALESQRQVIEELIQTQPQDWTASQQNLMTLHENANLYAQFLRSMTAVLPLNIEGNQNYIALKNLTSNEQQSALLKLIEAGGKGNTYFKIMPQDWTAPDQYWLSPWQAVHETEDKTLQHLQHWSKQSVAYRDNNQTQWDEAVAAISQDLSSPRLKLEYIYNFLKLLTVAGVLYFLSFLLLLLKQLTNIKQLYSAAYAIFSIGIIANVIDIILRVIILQRPPVGTLYESIIFVAVICTGGFLFFERKHKNKTGLLLGAITGCLLLVTAQSFAGEDTMDTLVAVLNTNFWLLTHVICITIGYAVCFIIAMLAHYYLCVCVWQAQKTELKIQLKQAIKTLIIFALLFTCIGTILGGIWADQSWGRFWGWDPKENGALLIVLWLVWMIHSHMTKDLNELGYMIAAGFLSVIVILAWFGVNLLNVGLHSYGFISGVMTGIVIFIALEVTILGGLYALIKKNETRHD